MFTFRPGLVSIQGPLWEKKKKKKRALIWITGITAFRIAGRALDRGLPRLDRANPAHSGLVGRPRRAEGFHLAPRPGGENANLSKTLISPLAAPDSDVCRHLP